MVARVNANGKFTVTFIRNDEEVDSRVARDGEKALKIALLMLAMLDELQAGDTLVVKEA